jgi:hypothetical protein
MPSGILTGSNSAAFAGMVKMAAPAAAYKIVRYMNSSLTLKLAATHSGQMGRQALFRRPKC